MHDYVPAEEEQEEEQGGLAVWSESLERGRVSAPLRLVSVYRAAL